MNLIKKLLIAGSFALVISGCKKSGPSPDSYISYKVDGVYKSSRPEADYIDDALLIESRVGSEEILIFFDGYPAPGLYDLLKKGGTSCYYSDASGVYDSILTEIGTLEIIAYDGKQVSGKFAFEGSNGKSIKSITEGEFNTKVEQLGYYNPASPSCEDDSSYYGVSPNRKLTTRLKLIRTMKLNSNAGK
jgi:hypothetical protein